MFPFELTALKVDLIHKRFYIGTKVGLLMIYSSTSPVKNIHQIQPVYDSPITTIITTANHLIYSHLNGYILVYEQKKSGKESLMHIIQQMELQQVLCQNLREIYANHNGSVVIMSTIQAQPINCLLAHPEPINKLALSENQRFLVTACKDKSVRIWILDSSGVDLQQTFESRVLEEQNCKTNIPKQQKSAKKLENSDDEVEKQPSEDDDQEEEELAGWDK